MDYGLQRYLGDAKKAVVKEHAYLPTFCSEHMLDFTVSLTVGTLFLYQLKWMNNDIEHDRAKSRKNLKEIQRK